MSAAYLYTAGALGLSVAGLQAGGAELLDQALSKDMSIQGVISEAGNLAGLGVNATDAAIIVAVTGLGYKLLQMATPFSETVNLWWRKRLLEPAPPAPPPQPPATPPKR